MLDINADLKVKASVCDLSQLMGKIKYKAGRISIFFMLRYINEGVFLTALRTIPVQKPDHLAAWMFIPYNLKISTAEIEDVMEVVIKSISNSKITSEIYAELRKLFDKDYDDIPYAAAIAPNNGTETAYRYYGDVTGYILSDLIGTKRYQTSYLPYSEVVLADKSLVSYIDGHSLTDEPLDQMVKLFPPASPDRTFRPTIFGCEFDQPYLAPLMGTVEIRWMQGHSLAAVQSVMVNRPNMKPDSLSLEELGGSPATADTPISRITNTYAAQEHDTPHAHRTHHTNPLDTPIHQQAPDVSSAEQQTEPIERKPISPIKNRITSLLSKARNFNRFRYGTSDASTKIVWTSIGFVAGVLLTLLCTCIHRHMTGSDSKVLDLSSDSLEISTPVETVDIPSIAENRKTEAQPKDEIKKPADTDTSMEAAIAYLEGFKTWDKNELDRYPELAGLYDDMNNFRLQRIVSYWGPKLKKSARFSKIVAHARQAIKRGKKPRVPEGQKTFNKGGKQSILIMTYLNTIDP